ncbi:hypothetical protein FOCC_FOCC000187 [Frankliniella occidentalis]|nr:hypothetical protein FOCC_FOCC000187 [Frankliniella occidentalis]
MGPEGKQEDCDVNKAYKTGCLELVVTAARDHAGTIGTAGIIVACIMGLSFPLGKMSLKTD